ncbi:LysM peptidoglycan-binding domain-containing protein [Salinispirillum sp. LH 10-3-1]|uniref:LysM peptidoglycan-binding domain-containing protein n=1 Tax=Salinispirillum sp. LH 10-3-1 TaxID=2952525 RepID=A0AB38YFX5_9GAMM
MRKRLIGLLLASCIAAVAHADILSIREDVPERYVVKSGDTLWDIAELFLQSPWRWNEIWYQNPQIENPHLIFPGDIIGLRWIDGEPRLTTLERGLEADTVRLTQDMADDGVVRLQPAVRYFNVDQAIPAIPREYIQPFLNASQIVTGEELNAAAYVVSGEEGRIVIGAGDRLYARGNWAGDGVAYELFRAGEAYRDPVTNDFLGVEAIALGRAEMEAIQGDVAKLHVVTSRSNIRLGDRLMLSERTRLEPTFFPATPPEGMTGQILSVVEGLSIIGQFNVVLLNRGAVDGVATGHVFDIMRQGEVVRDPINNQLIRLPEEQGGMMMVFRVFDRMSYALVMEATNTMKVGDTFRVPSIRRIP